MNEFSVTVAGPQPPLPEQAQAAYYAQVSAAMEKSLQIVKEEWIRLAKPSRRSGDYEKSIHTVITTKGITSGAKLGSAGSSGLRFRGLAGTGYGGQFVAGSTGFVGGGDIEGTVVNTSDHAEVLETGRPAMTPRGQAFAFEDRANWGGAKIATYRGNLGSSTVFTKKIAAAAPKPYRQEAFDATLPAVREAMAAAGSKIRDQLVLDMNARYKVT